MNTVLMSREHYRDLFAWSLQERDGLSWDEAIEVANVNLNENIRTLQAQEDAQLFRVLDELRAQEPLQSVSMGG